MTELIVVTACLILNAVFAALEMAFVSVAKPELRHLARSGNKDAQILLLLRDNPERTLSVLQIGISLVGAIAAAVGGLGAAEVFKPYLMQRFDLTEVTSEIIAVILIVLPITYASVVVGELVPKTLALRNPMRIILGGARWLKIADQLLLPIVRLLEASTKAILKIFFRRPKKSLKLEQTTIEIDAFSPVHRRFMLNMADIEKKTLKEIMLPWSKVNYVRSSDSIEVVTNIMLTSGHTRLPVLEEGNVKGILHTKEFVALKETGEKNWLPLIRAVLKNQASDSAFGVLRLMQEKHNHMTVVYSAEKELLGIVTLEDILEEVVGDIFDEDDDGKVRRVLAARVKSRSLPVE